jgi:uncharacterized membrane protein HdeD (DUF308 family)
MSNETSVRTGHLTLTGVLLMVFGIIAIATPAVAGTAVVLVIGAVLLIAGIVEFIEGFRADTWSSRIASLILGLLTVACGLGVLAHPILGLKVLTLLLAAFFVVTGFWKIIASFGFRHESGWLFMLASGLISLLLCVIIWQQWPVSGLWAVGILVGVDLLVTGISMIAMAGHLRRLHEVPTG